MLFILPSEKKKEYDDYEGNGQSRLLQNVKKEIKKRYPKTIVRGDGQVVVVSFLSLNKVVEVCPTFKNADGSFTYPDSSDGGSWKKTDPLPEVEEAESFNKDTNNNFRNICRLTRAWKNHIGFKFGGLLIDTLVWNFLKANTEYKKADFNDYLKVLQDLFKYLKDRDEEQSYWYALGSNQKVYNKNCEFVKKAKRAFNKIESFESECDELYDALQEIFGKTFPIPQKETVKKSASVHYSYSSTEQFIEERFKIDIRYKLKIDCSIKQKGFRDTSLRQLLKSVLPRINIHRKLRFFIVENEYDKLLTMSDLDYENKTAFKYDIYWKVLNRGDIAKRKDCIRGQINKGEVTITESADFNGEHIVECYIVYRDIVIARDRIKVPISGS